jgi:DNA repair photolyase
MSFRKQTGNMYEFVTHTWNVIKGECEHDCTYCYMKRFPLGELRFDKEELKRDLGEGNFIFVGSSNDMWSDSIPTEWIVDVMYHCEKYYLNKYLFQSKNPKRFLDFTDFFTTNGHPQFVLGTTIETNRDYCISKAPPVLQRAGFLGNLRFEYNVETMITIEPILDFDLDELVDLIEIAMPNWVNIGADSKKHNLPEPPFEKVRELIKELSKTTEVRQKKNLDRLKKEL